MADIIYKVMSWLYAIVAVTILSLWSIMMVVLLSADTLRNQELQLDKWTIVTLVAVPSLLTFLVCKIVMAVFPDTSRDSMPKGSKNAQSPGPKRHNTGNMIRCIATADDGSPQGAVVLLLLSVTWLLEVLQIMVPILILTGIVTIWTVEQAAHNLSPEEMANVTAAANTTAPTINLDLLEAKENVTAALNEFKETSGINLVPFFNSTSSSGLLALVTGLWVLLFALGGYIIALAVGAFKTILTSPKEAWDGKKNEDIAQGDKKIVEVASEVI